MSPHRRLFFFYIHCHRVCVVTVGAFAVGYAFGYTAENLKGKHIVALAGVENFARVFYLHIDGFVFCGIFNGNGKSKAFIKPRKDKLHTKLLKGGLRKGPCFFITRS